MSRSSISCAAFILSLVFTRWSETSTTTITEPPSTPKFNPLRWIKKVDEIPQCHSALSVCSFIEDRIWYSAATTPLCRCKNALCPNKWSTAPDKYTINFNGRAQFKFCSPVATTETCSSTQVALVRIEISNPRRKDVVIDAKCYCPPYYHYEYLRSNSTFFENNTQVVEWYRCKKLRHCKSGEFCGHITAEKFQPYYICSCPQKHMCLIKDRKKFTVKELLYDGEAYKGTCMSRE